MHSRIGRQAESAYPAATYAAYVIGVLFVATLLSQLDRQLPALLVRPLRKEFGISDTSFSLLQGYAFALVYTFCGLPLGWLVDRTVRRNLIIAGMLVWSVTTLLAGFAHSYVQLLFARMGVGVGEAVLAPAAYSLIADYVPPARRGRALGFYYVSLAIGSGASLLLGGLIARLIPPGGAAIPVVGHLAPWRLTFLTAGAPGILLALLLLTVREPVRREQGAQPAARVDVRAFLAYLRRHAATFGPLLTYPGVIALVGYGTLAWAPAFFDRRFGMPTAKAGMLIGLIVAGSGLVGTLVSAFLSDRWKARNAPAARLRVTLVGWTLILPAVATWSLAGDARLSLALLAVAVAGTAMAQAAAPAAIQEIVPNRMRGQAVAVYLLIGGLVGIGLGPMLVALVTDRVFHDPQALRYSLAIVGAPGALLGLLLTWAALKPYQRTAEALQTQLQAETAAEKAA